MIYLNAAHRAQRAAMRRSHYGETRTFIEEADVEIAGRRALIRADRVVLAWDWEPDDPSVGYVGGIGYDLSEPFHGTAIFFDDDTEVPVYVPPRSPLWAMVRKDCGEAFERECADDLERELEPPDDYDNRYDD